MPALADALAVRTRDGELYETYNGTWVRCFACGHECPIPDGAPGVCKVRFNQGGRLRVPWGYVAGAHCDPIEKKPFFHVVPGSRAFSFGMLGCDLHCGYCQNWITSQALRDPDAGSRIMAVDPRDLVDAAVRDQARSIVSTYNEPLITTEWAVAVFRQARLAGLLTGYVSNGNATPRVLEFLAPWIDLFKVDLKSFSDREYRKLGGRLQPVLDTIAALHRMGTWVEIVTLVVPGLNDSDRELDEIARFICGESPDIPWHVTSFHGDYKMADTASTSSASLKRAADIGVGAGLRYVYAGNLPGSVGRLEDTRCPTCRAALVERTGYRIAANRIGPGGACPGCGTTIPGRW